MNKKYKSMNLILRNYQIFWIFEFCKWRKPLDQIEFADQIDAAKKLNNAKFNRMNVSTFSEEC